VASPGRPVFQIVRLDPVEVSVGIPETDIHRVRVGQKAAIELPALPGERYTGAVRVINVAAEASTRTYMTRIQVANPKHALRLGMIAEVKIQGDTTRQMLSVPGEAVVHDAQGATQVFVYFPAQRRVYAKRVTVGSVAGQQMEIRAGLTGDELVVTGGQNKLRDATLVRAEGR
jgi:RND family efflux transporter MFP subunit